MSRDFPDIKNKKISHVLLRNVLHNLFFLEFVSRHRVGGGHLVESFSILGFH